MRLISLRLWNIRSYREATIEFGDGVNLFEGDIGSGKSSILLAVEFALFGLAEVASASLLRHGEKEGGVELVFGVKDRTVKATRKLRRSGSGASVKDCILEVDGRETRLSSNEMRQQVLELLEYGERRNPRARLDIFTYSVYTPQEDMRTVLTNDTKMRNQRKDTLRRALDLEEYDQAASNLDRVRLQLDNDAGELRGMASDIDDVKVDLLEAERDWRAEQDRLATAKEDADAASSRVEEAATRFAKLKEGEARYREALTVAKEMEASLARAEGEMRELAAKVDAGRTNAEELGKVRARIEESSGQLVELEGMEIAETRLVRLQGELKEAIGDLERKRAQLDVAEEASRRYKDAEKELEGIEDPAEGLGDIQKDLEVLRSKGVGLEHEVRRLEQETEAIDSEDGELTTLEGEATCPKCRQPLTEEHLESLLEANKKRRRDISSRLREVASQKNRALEDIEAKERALDDLERMAEHRRRLLQDLERARKDAEGLDERRRAVEDHPAISLERELHTLEPSRDPELLNRLRKLSGAVQELRKTEGRLEKALEGLPDLEKRFEGAQGAVKEAKTATERAGEELEASSADWDKEAITKAREEHQEALKADSSLQASMTGIKKMMGMLGIRVDKLREDVVRFEGILEREALHVHVSAWLSDRVIPAIRSMERSVMSLMSEEMDLSASQWFGHLVEDVDLVLAVDEDFVPSVTHQDFEMELNSLSGGERTAAAFAYRLALNGLVRRNATPDQRNLLILDEPTDGFSREQLGRMGNVFVELGADQVVVVSHDRELRNFADRVHLVEKIDGSSTVTQIA